MRNSKTQLAAIGIGKSGFRTRARITPAQRKAAQDSWANIDKPRWTITGSGNGRAIRLNGDTVVTLTQVGWRWSRRWDVRAYTNLLLVSGDFLFSTKTLAEAVARVTKLNAPTHESEKWYASQPDGSVRSEFRPLPESQVLKIRSYFRTLEARF